MGTSTGSGGGAAGGAGRSGASELLRPKWLVGHVLALGLVLLFVNFGFWQLDRLQQRTANNELIEQRMSAQPVPLEELLAQSSGDLDALAYRRVLTRGEFDPENELLLRSRSRDGEAGYHVLTPLVRDDGNAVLVNRGWLPFRMDELPAEEAAPPAGRVTVEGLARPDQDPPEGFFANFAPRDPPEGELEKSYYVDIDRFAPQMPYPLESVYVVLSAQEPAQAAGSYPLTPEPPDLERGSHLSYALQWFSFAAIGIIGYALLLRKTVKES